LKISDVSVTLFAWEGLKPASYSFQSVGGTSDLGLVTLRTDDGLEGHAFLGTAAHPASLDADGLIRYLKPTVIGQDPLDRERLYHALWRHVRRTPARTIGAVDVALWDLAGKIAGLPVHKLLGSYRDKAPAYASSLTMTDPAAYIDDAERIRDLGWTAYKIHPPRSWKDDIAVCEAVRKAVGDSYMLMLDSTWTYDFTEAVRVGRAIEEMGYYWFEDPLAEFDIYNYVKLRQKLDIPIMATEHTPGQLESYVPWLTERATDYLRGDVAIKGGLTSVIKTAHLAEAFGMRYEIHHGGNSLNNVANLHALMAIRNSEMFEVIQPDDAQKYGLVRDIEVDGEGMVHAPVTPGLGAEIDFALIERKKIAVLQ
jgi:L-alanine-DL-glutamate epimerase-like enolase superfamily enzyme